MDPNIPAFWQPKKKKVDPYSPWAEGDFGIPASQRPPPTKESRPPVASGWDYAEEHGWGSAENDRGQKRKYIPDVRFENPDLDIEPEIYKQASNPRTIMRDANEKHLSELEKKNKDYLGHTHNASKIVNIIDGEVVSSFDQEFDDRTEYRARDGTYVDGINRGRMKKRYEDEHQRLSKERDKELIQATKILRAWNALSEDEKQRRLQKAEENKARMWETLEITTEDMPEEYRREVDRRAITEWESTASSRSWVDAVSGQSRSSSLAPPVSGTLSFVTNDEPALFLDDEGVRRRHQQSYRNATHGNRGPSGRRGRFDHHHRRLGKVTKANDRRHEHRSSSDERESYMLSGSEDSLFLWPPAPSVASSTATPPYTGPEIMRLADAKIQGDYSDLKARDAYDKLKQRCKEAGRIVCVKLDDKVTFNAEAVVSRLFGGIIQEIQLHPDKHSALAIFLDPDCAYAFVTHHDTLRQRNSHEYRRLQLHAQWYDGKEQEALYRSQPQVLSSVLAKNMSRVLLLTGIDSRVKRADVLTDLKHKFRQQMIVRVALLQHAKAYVQRDVGSMLRVEFASIKDAIDAYTRLKKKDVPGYNSCDIEFLRDPCNRHKPFLIYCTCAHCRQSSEKDLFGDISEENEADGEEDE